MRKINKVIIFLLIIPLLLIFSWFRDGGIHGQGEESLSYYDAATSSKLYSTTWRNKVSAGYYNSVDISRAPFFSALQLLISLGIPNFLIQAFVDYLLMVTGVLSIYFLVKKTIGVQFGNTMIPVTAALFYLLNPFSVTQIWGRGLYMQSFPFALFPLFLLLYIIALQARKILPILLAIIASFILTQAFQNISYVASLWVIILLYSIFHIYYHRKDLILTISYFGLIFFGWILTQAWWLALYFKSTADVYSAQTGLATENLGTLLGVSKDYPLPSIIRLIHEGYFFRDSKYGDIYNSIPFQLISWLIPVIALFSIKYFKENRHLRFFIILFMIGLIVSLGANLPFGSVFTWLFTHIPPLQIFRNPFEKFGLVLILGYSVLFAVGLKHINEKIKMLWGAAASVFVVVAITGLVLGVYSWPLWTGRAISGIDDKVGIIVPSYYQDLRDRIQSIDSAGYRLMMLPVASGEGVVYQWGDKLYNGYPPTEYLLDYPAISSTPRFIYLYDYLMALRKYMPQMNTAPAISLLGVEYLVDRQDMVMISQGEKEQKNYLLNTIFPPLGISGSEKIICKSLMSQVQVENSIWLMCEPIDSQANWQDIKYLHLKIAADAEAVFEIAVRDSAGNRPRWDGNADSAYTLNAGEVEAITMPLGAPTEYNEKINFADIRLIEIRVHPKDKNQIIRKVDIEGLWLDEGKAERIDEYISAGEFAALKLYRNNKFNTPPHFGLLQRVEKADNFKEFFEKAEIFKSEVNKTGFILADQNIKRDRQKITDVSGLAVAVSISEKISNEKYFIEVNSENPFYLVLSELFDPNWKLIPDIDKNDLNGGFFNNLKLLKKVYFDESNHFVVNGYANLWIAQGSRQYAAVFRPQLIRDAGFTIALWTIGILSLFGIALIAKKKIKAGR